MPFSFLFGHGNASNKFDETITVSFWWDRGNLGSILRNAFEEVFDLFHGPILHTHKLVSRFISMAQESKGKKEHT